jgi:hypothetical protein
MEKGSTSLEVYYKVAMNIVAGDNSGGEVGPRDAPEWMKETQSKAMDKTAAHLLEELVGGR